MAERQERKRVASVIWELTLLLFNCRCAYCKVGAPTCREHVVNSLGNDLGNIVPACMTCNSKKQNKPCANWMRSIGLDVEEFDRTRAAIARLQSLFP